MDSPVGRILLAGELKALHVIGFSSGSKARGADADWERFDEPFRGVKQQLAEYFDGKRKQFDLVLAPAGTAFQLSVWHALQNIPYGDTCAYSDVAQAINKPAAVRAVGAANGSNPLPIVIPCHRVIGKNGSLTGFGGGLESKRLLLELEARHSGLFG